ncbi:tyrosine-type recombinase/integrase [Ktedonobacter sp. SOSP1-85]|uniref:tyrosine-type recombinase/integrase n=1 Tax=Ktedonobacter sp. SOSP1-85 TaxID=2778367 RepID=UPI001915EA96|nr:tyrosine-type recombinase/integrase [Ktedonobacter sp. SOSP1-85]
MHTHQSATHQDHHSDRADTAHLPILQSQALTGEQVFQCIVTGCPHLVHLPEDGILVAWLDAKTGKSHSRKTHLAYHSTALSCRDALRAQGYDLFMDLSERGTRAHWLLIVQRWAGERAATSTRAGAPANSTYNQRLAILSSLFVYAHRQQLYQGDNPIELLERRKVYDYASAEAIEPLDMRKLLAAIDRTTISGLRDYALLSLALHTGQRVQVLADMRVGHLTRAGAALRVTFPRAKGGKRSTRQLGEETSAALITYLEQVYGTGWAAQGEAPVWMSLSRNQSRGQSLSLQALEQICARRLGTSKFHVTRHTAAKTLDQLGVSASEIQEFLDHESLATTGRYLKVLKRAEHKYSRDLEQIFGIEAPSSSF